jgi:hypothetical protein
MAGRLSSVETIRRRTSKLRSLLKGGVVSGKLPQRA